MHNSHALGAVRTPVETAVRTAAADGGACRTAASPAIGCMKVQHGQNRTI
jgi:hypothetical protein